MSRGPVPSLNRTGKTRVKRYNLKNVVKNTAQSAIDLGLKVITTPTRRRFGEQAADKAIKQMFPNYKKRY